MLEALPPDQRALFVALGERGIRSLIVGLRLERVIVRKRATGRPRDAASLPALEATLRARRG